ncbi:hypothetical protein HG535_0A05710 [Zygotorulaspora mrakii]|uniref:Mediator of RNA polymerase II transcription subunit 8 n=1 Tax=Zygotorulaspora mrakii TaxID=42260 RepID=A0A7H9AW60_ZYGMR|nr:uncharacterized protein HG535_0A05710 [Zygotorulaspora mrakii]QLG70630.1 hypothetical protein HG535_0A05710 [Zygotorulaspora mrakii]
MNTDANSNSFQEDLKPNFDGVPSQALDAVRMRAAQLTHSLKRIRDELSRAELPQWHSLQSQVNVTLSQLMSLTSTLQHFQDTLDSTVVFPLPNFPTTSHEGLLTTLLRKKYTPEVDEWIASAREAADLDQSILDPQAIDKLLKDEKDVTEWALQTLVKEFERYSSGADYAEQNSGATEDEQMIDVSTVNCGKPTKPFDSDQILKYTSKGEIPSEIMHEMSEEGSVVITE